MTNPAAEDPIGVIASGAAQDADRAVKAARRAFPAFAATGVDDRIALLDKIIGIHRTRTDEMSRVI